MPRTFLGPLLISSLLNIFNNIFCVPILQTNLSDNPRLVQSLARLILILFHTHALSRLANHASKRICKTEKMAVLMGNYFFLICASQFYIIFYSSRTLPNVFAMILITHAFTEWFKNDQINNNNNYYNYKALGIIVFTMTIFRCDMLLLLAPVTLSMFCMSYLNETGAKTKKKVSNTTGDIKMSVKKTILTGLIYGISSLCLTVSVDSIIWQRIVWPEGVVLFFNTVENKSGEWGTSPWHFYFTRFIPKAMLFTIFLIPFSFIQFPHHGDMRIIKMDTSILPYLTPIISFVAIYSFLPHKEARFIFPVLSIFNITAAHGITRLHSLVYDYPSTSNTFIIASRKKNDDLVVGDAKQSKSIGKYKLVRYFLLTCGLLSILLSFMVSSLFLLVSKHNYPGGEALFKLEEYVRTHRGIKDRAKIQVHVDILSGMTGVSKFGQYSAILTHQKGNKGELTFEKSGYEEDNNLSFYRKDQFTHLLSEKQEMKGYHVIDTITGYPSLSFSNLVRFRFPLVNTKDAIYILEKDGFN